MSKIEKEFLDKIDAMMHEQATSEYNSGDKWNVVAYKKDKFSGEDLIYAEMVFDRRDGVTDRQSAIQHMINSFPLPEDVKIEASKI